MSTPKPSIGQLWHQAGGDGERYRELMRQHGYLLRPGDEGYEEGSRTLACGWPGSVTSGTPAQRGAREALLSLGAEIETLNDWPKLESITEETHQYARGVIKGIAEMARRQAQQGQGSPSGSPGLSQDTREGQERTEPLSASLTDGEADRIGRAAYGAYASLRTGQMADGRVYPAWDELDLTEQFAWEAGGAAGLDAGASAVAATEQAKLQPAIDRVQHLAAAAQEKAVEHAVRAERERIRQRLVGCRECGEIHGDAAHAEYYPEGEYDHPGSAPWQAAGPNALEHLGKLLGDGPVP